MDTNTRTTGVTTEEVLRGDIPRGSECLHFPAAEGRVGELLRSDLSTDDRDSDREARARDREERSRQREGRRTYRDDRDDDRDDRDYYSGRRDGGRSRYNRDRYSRLDDRRPRRLQPDNSFVVPGTDLSRADHRYVNDRITELDYDAVDLEREIEAVNGEIARKQAYLVSLNVEKIEVMELRKLMVDRMTALVGKKAD